MLNALGVEDVLFITVEGSHEIVAEEVAPADGTLSPQASLTLVQITATMLLLLLGLFVLEFGLV